MEAIDIKEPQLIRAAKPITTGRNGTAHLCTGCLNNFYMHDLVKLELGKAPTVPCNLDPDYKIGVHEKDYCYLVEQFSPLYDQATGELLTKPTLHIYNIENYQMMEKSGMWKGLKIRILHDPKKDQKEAIAKKIEVDKIEDSGK